MTSNRCISTGAALALALARGALAQPQPHQFSWSAPSISLPERGALGLTRGSP
jgi:hypothetical protein